MTHISSAKSAAFGALKCDLPHKVSAVGMTVFAGIDSDILRGSALHQFGEAKERTDPQADWVGVGQVGTVAVSSETMATIWP